MIDKLDAKKAVRWLRLEPEEREKAAAEAFAVPTWTQVKLAVARRDNEAMEIVLTFIEEA